MHKSLYKQNFNNKVNIYTMSAILTYLLWELTVVILEIFTTLPLWLHAPKNYKSTYG